MPNSITDIHQLDIHATYTYADYLKWQFDDLLELIKGKIFFMSPAPRSGHQEIAGNIYAEIHQYLKRKTCKVYTAPFDVRFPVKGQADIYTVVQPDICIICDREKIDEWGCIGAPNMIVEVVSPSTAKKDFNEKYNLYEEEGVQEYWIVLPKEKAVTVYLLDESGKFVLSNIYETPGNIPVHVLAGFSIAWDDIFYDV